MKKNMRSVCGPEKTQDKGRQCGGVEGANPGRNPPILDFVHVEGGVLFNKTNASNTLGSIKKIVVRC